MVSHVTLLSMTALQNLNESRTPSLIYDTNKNQNLKRKRKKICIDIYNARPTSQSSYDVHIVNIDTSVYDPTTIHVKTDQKQECKQVKKIKELLERELRNSNSIRNQNSINHHSNNNATELCPVCRREVNHNNHLHTANLHKEANSQSKIVIYHKHHHQHQIGKQQNQLFGPSSQQYDIRRTNIFLKKKCSLFNCLDYNNRELYTGEKFDHYKDIIHKWHEYGNEGHYRHSFTASCSANAIRRKSLGTLSTSKISLFERENINVWKATETISSIMAIDKNDVAVVGEEAEIEKKNNIVNTAWNMINGNVKSGCYCRTIQEIIGTSVADTYAEVTRICVKHCWQNISFKCIQILQILLFFLQMQILRNNYFKRNILKRQELQPQQQQKKQEQCSSTIRLINIFLNSTNQCNNNTQNSYLNNDYNITIISRSNYRSINSSSNSKQQGYVEYKTKTQYYFQYEGRHNPVYHHHQKKHQQQYNDYIKYKNSCCKSFTGYAKYFTSHFMNDLKLNVQRPQVQSSTPIQRNENRTIPKHPLNTYNWQTDCKNPSRVDISMEPLIPIETLPTQSLPSLSTSPLLAFRLKSIKNIPKLLYSNSFIILLSFLMLFVPLTCAQTSFSAPDTIPSATKATASSTTNRQLSKVHLSQKEHVCPSMDIRNHPNNLDLLQNCTVIEGFLLFTLINTKGYIEFKKSYPLLTEVTEYVVVFRVHKLRSLGQIFPNLAIIRGEELFQSTFALVIFSNPDLVEIGLTKLSAITRGGVRLQNNMNLCYAETIDWNEIVSSNAEIKIKDNRPIDDCPKCPGSYILNEEISEPNDNMLSCRESAGILRCWNSTSCQKICPKECPRNCYDEHRCCNPACLGGCTSNPDECISCRHFSIDNTTCIDDCPTKLFNYLNRRCITAETCDRIGKKFDYNEELHLVAFNKTCSTRCPPYYKLVNKTCEPCGEFCKKKCVGGVIDDVNRARQFEGCTEIIDEGLSISIKIGGSHVTDDLRKSLSSIQIIRTYLKVHNTYAMASLSYFENLKIIGGEKLLDDKFALYVLENNDLSEIWGANQSVKIENGTIYFHFNPKLCRDKIMLLTRMMNQSIEVSEIEVSKDSNGSKVSCDNTTLNATVVSIGSSFAEIVVDSPYIYPDPRAFIGYQLLFMIDEHKNATKFTYGPCDDKWNVTEPFKTHSVMIFSLKPYTQYAYYVKTKTISSVSKNMESPMGYFTTKSSTPTAVSVTTYAITATNFSIRWLPPRSANGKLVKYTVNLTLDDRPSPDTRNYCKLLDRPDIEVPSVVQKESSVSAVEEKCPAVTDPKKDTVVGRDKNQVFDDIEIEEFIYFENGIQNFVFRKKDDDNKIVYSNFNTNNINNSNANVSQLVRKRRNMNLNTEYILISRHVRDTTENSTVGNEYIKDSSFINKNSRYNISFSKNVSATTTEFTFENLKPFSRYFVNVAACRELEINETNKECSVQFQYTVKTLKQENVDIVRNFEVSVEATNSSRGVRLRWDPPEFPNGDVVSYTIEYQLQAQDAASEKKCITQMDYMKMTNGYLLTGLSTGNYKIRVRVNTLAGNGIFTAFKYVYIKPVQLSTLAICFIVLGVLVLVSIIIGGGIYMRKKVVAPSDLLIFPTVNPYYVSPPYMPDEWEVPRERIIQLNPLGQGSFGMVYEGLLKGYNNSTEDTLCAIKTTNENATDSERISFLNEASVMKEFDTHHVVRLLGVCSLGQPALVIMELMKNGDLKTYLRAHRPLDQREDIGLPVLSGGTQPPPLSRIYQMAIEIADGMAYLAAKKYVHRDLAARNCMVAADLTVKIGDFGMTRDIYETDYYRKGTKGLLPVRWMPPESLRDGIYSSASDVFSYGVVLWEMATLAAQPYQGFSNDQVLHHVIDGGVMERPDNCPDRLYSLMQKCWLYRPSARPSFMEIIHILYDMADPKFEEVSFYNSSEGQQILNKELASKSQRSDDIYDDHDNIMDDATTPLHVGDYSVYKLNMANNSSIENQDESPMITCDDNLHSPYSTGSVMIANSASDGQSRNSYSLSHKLYNPSAVSVVGFVGTAPQHSSSSNIQNPYKSLQRQHQQSDDNIGTETDDGGYQIYDPSPTYRDHGTHGGTGDGNDVDDFCKLSGGQNLLLSQKAAKRFPTILSMSSSMPDEIIRFPSNASAASSNASSTATGTTGVRQSLKNVLPTRLLGKNRLFQHKNSSSNSNNKNTSSNTAGLGSVGGYNSNGSRSDLLNSTNKVLGTIESGGSGSAGSYCITPPNQRSTNTTSDACGGGTGYKLLDESVNISGLSHQFVENRLTPPIQSLTSSTLSAQNIDTLAQSTKSSVLKGLTTSSNPNYQLMDKLYTKNDDLNKQSTLPAIDVSENPNYVMMNDPFIVPENSQPIPVASEKSRIPFEIANISVNPNYLTMTPNPIPVESPIQNPASSVSEDEYEGDIGTQHRHIGEHIPMTRLQQHQSNQQEQQQQEQNVVAGKTKGISSSKTDPAPIRQRKQKQRGKPPPNGFIGPETT